MMTKFAQSPLMLALADRLGRHHAVHPLEGLLRPPVEWYASAAYGAMASLFLVVPEWLMLSTSVGRLAAALLFVVALRRFLQGLRVVLYQKHLTILPEYKLSSAELIKQQQYNLATKQFVGRGFKWTALHTQRYRELSDADNAAFINTTIDRVEGGNPALHGVEFTENDVFINQGEWHTSCI